MCLIISFPGVCFIDFGLFLVTDAKEHLCACDSHTEQQFSSVCTLKAFQSLQTQFEQQKQWCFRSCETT